MAQKCTKCYYECKEAQALESAKQARDLITKYPLTALSLIILEGGEQNGRLNVPCQGQTFIKLCEKFQAPKNPV
jgi:hypothetical protein